MLRRLLGFPERSEMPLLVDGEVISLNRRLTPVVAAAVYSGILTLLPLLVYLFYPVRALLAISFFFSMFAALFVGTVALCLKFKPRLILGVDRIQCASGLTDVDWEIKYDQIAEIRLFTLCGERFIGINFTEASRLHPVCEALRKSFESKKLGYDFYFNCGRMPEHPEAIFEAIQRCYRGFQEDKQSSESETPATRL
jgi:hypothetical protein